MSDRFIARLPQTNHAALAIMTAEAKARKDKTERLKAECLARDSQPAMAGWKPIAR